MKKLAVILAAMLVLTAITACTKKSVPSNDDKKDNQQTEQSDKTDEKTPDTTQPQTQENSSEGAEQMLNDAKGQIMAVSTKELNDSVTLKDSGNTIFTRKLAKASVAAKDRNYTDAAKAINTKLEAAYKRHETEADDLKNDVYDFAVDDEGNVEVVIAQPWTIETKYDTARNDEVALSMLESLYYYAGGAHPSSVQFSYNFDTKTGKQLSYDDIIGTDEKAIADFEKKIEEKLFTKYGEDSFDSDYMVNGQTYADASKDSWYLKDGKLVVHFNQYDIAPYAAGEFDVEFTKDELPASPYVG